jgi:hypothetical protein
MKQIFNRQVLLSVTIIGVLIFTNIGSTKAFDFGDFTSDYSGGYDYGDYTSDYDGGYDYGDYTSDYGGGYDYGDYTSDFGGGYDYGDYTSDYDGGYDYGDYTSDYDYDYGDYTSDYDYDYGDYTSDYDNYGYTPSWTGYDYTGTNYFGTGYIYPTYPVTPVTPVLPITCPSGTHLVNGTCVINTTTCPAGSTLVNGVCTFPTQCPAGQTLQNGVCRPITQCPAGQLLIENVCRPVTQCPPGTNLVNGVCVGTVQCPTGTNLVNGVCVPPTGNCPAGLILVNGACVPPIGTCPTGTTLVNGVCTYPSVNCPAGQTLINGVCTYPTQTCPAGMALINGVCTFPTANCPVGTTLINGVCTYTGTQCPPGTHLVNGTCVTNTTQCPAGTVFQNGSCITIITNVNTYTCPNGVVVNYSYQCPSPVIYQTCWDGSTIPSTSVCPAQYKVCPNGTSIPVNQTCFIGNNYIPYTPPPVIVFNNVVTSVVTEITNTSARCNGIGLIANGALSTGWFEYGETPSLGRSTASASIGSAPTATFSNVLANLKPNTRYYCRAVMQNQHGTVKGEIVGFTTKGTAVAYVKPVTTTTKVTTKTATKKTNQILCVDGTYVTTGSDGAASLINNGEKLIALQIEKSSGGLSSNQTVVYKLTYKNLSDTRVTGVAMRVNVPVEITGVLTSSGTYDEAGHTIILSQNSIDPYATGVVTWSGKIAKDAPAGKSIVTTAYTSYTVPGTSVTDEVTAYVVDQIAVGSNTNTNNDTKVSVDRAFLPDNLVEWLALIAIIFIIFILGRSVYTSYREDRRV